MPGDGATCTINDFSGSVILWPRFARTDDLAFLQFLGSAESARSKVAGDLILLDPSVVCTMTDGDAAPRCGDREEQRPQIFWVSLTRWCRWACVQ